MTKRKSKHMKNKTNGVRIHGALEKTRPVSSHFEDVRKNHQQLQQLQLTSLLIKKVSKNGRPWTSSTHANPPIRTDLPSATLRVT